jgi:hypothetical protein
MCHLAFGTYRQGSDSSDTHSHFPLVVFSFFFFFLGQEMSLFFFPENNLFGCSRIAQPPKVTTFEVVVPTQPLWTGGKKENLSHL